MKPKEPILELFANNVVRIRKSKGMSQEELGFRADLHRTYIGRMERGKNGQFPIKGENLQWHKEHCFKKRVSWAEIMDITKVIDDYSKG